MRVQQTSDPKLLHRFGHVGRVGIGDEVEGAYLLVNRSARAITVRLFDQMPPQVEGGVGETTVAMLAHDSVRVPFTIRGISRGKAPLTQLAGEWTRFELALSSALILTDIASNAGDKVGTLVFDDEVRAFVPAQRSRGSLQLVRDALVPVTATTREPDYAAAFRFLAAHQRKRALIVFFTDVIDVRASQALLAHVSRSAARHLALVVALRNDDIFAAAVPKSVGSTALLYENAAAEELIQAREEALERMRRAGAVVLDVSPRVMTASVINRYLELKARGAI